MRPATSDLERIKKSIDSLEASGHTALWEAIVYSLVQLQGTKGRKALIVFSDGSDEDENFPFRSSMRIAREMGVPIYLVLMRKKPDESAAIGLISRSFSSRAVRLAEATGGRVFYAKEYKSLDAVYDEIEAELRSQYLLTYYPKNSAGAASSEPRVPRGRRRGARRRAARPHFERLPRMSSSTAAPAVAAAEIETPAGAPPSRAEGRLYELWGEIRDLSAAFDLLDWDQETYMPEGGLESRGKVGATLAGLKHRLLTAPELADVIAQCAAEAAPSSVLAGQVRLAKQEVDRSVKIPEALAKALAEARSRGAGAWQKARAAADFRLFERELGELVALRKEQAAALLPGGRAYDALLDTYETGSTEAALAPLFAGLVAELKPLVQAVVEQRQGGRRRADPRPFPGRRPARAGECTRRGPSASISSAAGSTSRPIPSASASRRATCA